MEPKTPLPFHLPRLQTQGSVSYSVRVNNDPLATQQAERGFGESILDQLLDAIEEENCHKMNTALFQNTCANTHVSGVQNHLTGLPPLFVSLRQRIVNEKVVMLLIRAGADPNLSTQSNQLSADLKPIDYIISRENILGYYHISPLLVMAGGRPRDENAYHTMGINPVIIDVIHNNIIAVADNITLLQNDTLLEHALIHALTHSRVGIFHALFGYMNKSLAKQHKREQQIINVLLDWVTILKQRDQSLPSKCLNKSLEEIKLLMQEHLTFLESLRP